MDGNENEATMNFEDLKKEVEELRRKNNDLLSEVAVAGCVKEDLVELDRQRSGLEDEKKTLESLLLEARDEVTMTRTRYEHECARLKAVLDQMVGLYSIHISAKTFFFIFISFSRRQKTKN